MSAGDIDDKIGPEEALPRLQTEFPELKAYMDKMDSLPIVLGQVPFGAGISEDGQIRYVDPRLCTILDGVNVCDILATHESVEWALRSFCHIGIDYASDPRGHRLANRAEYDKVEAVGLDWMDYDNLIDPQIRAIEVAKLTAVPSDLAMYPYADSEDLMDAIKEVKGKLPKDSVQYTDHGDPDICGDCINFDKGACALVKGEISQEGWCEEWCDQYILEDE